MTYKLIALATAKGSSYQTYRYKTYAKRGHGWYLLDNKISKRVKLTEAIRQNPQILIYTLAKAKIGSKTSSSSFMKSGKLVNRKSLVI